MNETKVTGKIEQVLDYKSGVGANSGKAWSKQGYLLAYKRGEHEYDAKLAFDVWGDERIKNFGLNVGDVVTLTLDISSREYGGRWYTDITAYRCEHVGVEEEPQDKAAQFVRAAQEMENGQNVNTEPANGTPSWRSFLVDTTKAVPNGVPYTEPDKNSEPQKEDDLPF